MMTRNAENATRPRQRSKREKEAVLTKNSQVLYALIKTIFIKKMVSWGIRGYPHCIPPIRGLVVPYDVYDVRNRLRVDTHESGSEAGYNLV